MTRSFLSVLTGSFATPAAENPTVAMVEAAYRHHDLDALAESASIIGAVNCAVRRDEGFVGENTDGQGFVASLRTVIDPAGRHVVVLGAGGAARAIAVETALAGAASITIVNRSAERGSELADLVATGTPARATFVPWDRSFVVPPEADVLVNATSIGLFPDVGATPDVDLESLHPGLVVADVIPNPPHTAFLRAAADRGATTLDGLGMLVEQGAVAIQLWTGVDPDRAVMRAALEEIFGS